MYRLEAGPQVHWSNSTQRDNIGSTHLSNYQPLTSRHLPPHNSNVANPTHNANNTNIYGSHNDVQHQRFLAIQKERDALACRLVEARVNSATAAEEVANRLSVSAQYERQQYALEENIRNCIKEVEKLKRENDLLRREDDALRMENEQFQRQVRSLEEDVHSYTKEAEKLRRESEALKKEKMNADQELHVVKQRCQRLLLDQEDNQKVSALERDLMTLKGDLRSLRSENDALLRQVDALNDENVDLQRKNKKLMDEDQLFQKQKLQQDSFLTEKQSDLQQRVLLLESENAALNRQLIRVQKDSDAETSMLRMKITQLQQQLSQSQQQAKQEAQPQSQQSVLEQQLRQRTSEQEERIQALMQQVKLGKETNSEKERELLNLKTEIEAMRIELNSVTMQKERLQSNLQDAETLIARCTTLENENRSLLVALDEKDNSFNMLNAKLQTDLVRLSNVERENERLKSDMKSLRLELNTSNLQKDAVQKKLTEVELVASKCTSLESDNQNLAHELETRDQDIETLIGKMESDKQRMDELENEVNRFHGEVTSLRGQKALLQQQIADNNRLTNSLSTELESFKAKAVTLEKSINRLTTESNLKDVELTSAQIQKDGFEKSLKEAAEKNDLLQQEVTSLKQKVESLENISQERDHDEEVLFAQVEEGRAQISSLEIEIVRLTEQVEQSQQQLADLRTEKEEFENKCNELESSNSTRTDELLKENEKLKQELDQLDQDLETLVGKMEFDGARMVGFEREIDRLKSEIKSMRLELSANKVERESLQKKLSEVEVVASRCSSLEAENENLTQEVLQLRNGQVEMELDVVKRISQKFITQMKQKHLDLLNNVNFSGTQFAPSHFRGAMSSVVSYNPQSQSNYHGNNNNNNNNNMNNNLSDNMSVAMSTSSVVPHTKYIEGLKEQMAAIIAEVCELRNQEMAWKTTKDQLKLIQEAFALPATVSKNDQNSSAGKTNSKVKSNHPSQNTKAAISAVESMDLRQCQRELAVLRSYVLKHTQHRAVTDAAM